MEKHPNLFKQKNISIHSFFLLFFGRWLLLFFLFLIIFINIIFIIIIFVKGKGRRTWNKNGIFIIILLTSFLFRSSIIILSSVVFVLIFVFITLFFSLGLNEIKFFFLITSVSYFISFPFLSILSNIPSSGNSSKILFL